MQKPINPLREPVPKEVPLENAPLLRVIGQIRFPLIEKINSGQAIAQFQEAVRSLFPILREESLPQFILSPNGPTRGADLKTWKFQSIEGDWLLSLTSSFVALETEKYTSRADFVSKLQSIYSNLDAAFNIPIIDRIGLRYIDRIEFSKIEELLDLTSQEVLGILATPIAEDAELTIQENLFSFAEIEGRMRARWGVVPPNTTIDPTVIEPSKKRTWILDLDSYSTPKKRYSETELKNTLEKFAEKSYSVFRWIVSDNFLRRYGGDPC